MGNRPMREATGGNFGQFIHVAPEADAIIVRHGSEWGIGNDELLALRRLRNVGMPGHEIDEILRTDDPCVIHRYLELHRERLEERLAEQREVLSGIEALLTGGDCGVRGSRDASAR